MFGLFDFFVGGRGNWAVNFLICVLAFVDLGQCGLMRSLGFDPSVSSALEAKMHPFALVYLYVRCVFGQAVVLGQYHRPWTSNLNPITSVVRRANLGLDVAHASVLGRANV